MRSVALSAVVLLVAGCASTSEPDQAPDEPVRTGVGAPGQDGGPDGPASAELRLSESGEPGDWIVVYAPFAEPSESVGFGFNYNVEAFPDGDGPGAFFWPFGTTRVDGDGFDVDRGNPFEERYVTFKRSQQRWVGSGGMGSGSSEPFAGLFFAFAAESPWTMDISIEADPALLPATILRGGNATFEHGVDFLVPAPGGGPANQASYQFQVPAAGWSHMEIIRTRLQPDGVQQVDITLPNGHSHNGLGLIQGYYVVLVGSAGSSIVDYLGSLRDVPGTATIDMTYADASIGFDFAHVGIPFDASLLPGLGAGNYTGSLWPFQQPQLPDPP